jgi:1-deoxy-D-xylulose-5-phosphate synthase
VGHRPPGLRPQAGHRPPRQFGKLRQAGGLSGYPSREESPHDWIENSHASTVISYAHGLATAQQSEHGEGRRVVAVIGDGSLTGGMAYEGLNNLGHSGRDAIIVLNDNGRSYAPTVSRLGESLNRLRASPLYVRETSRIERILSRIPLVGRLLRKGLQRQRAPPPARSGPNPSRSSSSSA